MGITMSCFTALSVFPMRVERFGLPPVTRRLPRAVIYDRVVTFENTDVTMEGTNRAKGAVTDSGC